MLAKQLTIVTLGVLVVAAIGYNVWSRSGGPDSSNASPPSSASTGAAPASATAPVVTPEMALAPAEPPAAALTATSVSWNGYGGSIDAELALSVDAEHRPAAPAVEFDEQSPAIFVSLKSTLSENVTVGVIWRRLASDAIPARDIAEQRVLVPAGQQRSQDLRSPERSGFLPGDYELQISVGNINPKTLAFRITSKFPEARHVVMSEGLPGLNVAVAALGGRIASANAGLKSDRYSAANLIDGFPFQSGSAGYCAVCGWSSGGDQGPYEIVFALAGDRPVTIDAVVIDPTTEETTQGRWNVIPRQVRISASATAPDGGFTEIATAQVTPKAIEQLVRTPPTQARFIKLEILSNWGGNTTTLGEVKVLEHPGPSALAGWPRNLALPALGGVIARFSSQDSPRSGVQHLIDNVLEEPWVSADNYLPQDLVFAFKDDQVAKIDRIVLRPHGRTPDTWPKKVLVSVSNGSFFDFDDVGQFDLPKEDRDVEFRVTREARFLRIRILENHGGRVTTLNDVRILEDQAPGYVSVLARTSPLATPPVATAAGAKADVDEQESNNEVTTANAIAVSNTVGGAIQPLGERDHFSIDVPPGPRQVLSLQIAAAPYIKTSVVLLDKDGRDEKRFDPAQAAGTEANVSWLIEPGKRVLQVSEPPASIVLIWDTSGSMNGMTEALREAVLAYVSNVRPTERLNMIRFSDDVEVLLKEFTSDPGVLTSAAGSDKFYPEGGTRFYDAVQQGVELLSTASGNRAIIVLSDGEDSLSRMDAPRFWEMLQRERIRLYTIGLGVALKGFATRVGSTGQRFMAHSSYVTNGRTFFARDTSELKTLYDRIAEELRAVSRYVIRPTVSSAIGRLSLDTTGERLASVSAPAQVQLVLDASGSMNRRIGNRRMIDAAKDVLTATIKALPNDIQVGLRVYGHRIREGQNGACEDSQQVQPIGRLDRTRLTTRIQGITALGTTPIAYSLQQVGNDLAKSTGQQMVILVTDGKEECGGDPKAAVAALRQQGLNVRVNIVGFALTDKVAAQQLTEAAALTGGTYTNAKDDAALQDALDRAMRVPFEVLDSSGTSIASGQIGDAALQIPEGHYTVVVRAADHPITIPNVRVVADRDSRIELKKEGSAVGVKVTQP